MAQAINRLTAAAVKNLREPGMHADGRGLYLRIDDAGGRRWVLIFHQNGRRREMGLGGSTVTLADARRAAEEARAIVAGGGDPIAQRKALSTPRAETTFGAMAEALIEDMDAGWRGGRSRQQWTGSLKLHAAKLWSTDVADIDTEAVLKALRPIWSTKHETANRVRGRIERVLDVARVRGLRTGENPARWRGHLEILLNKPDVQVKHHTALPYADMSAFITALRSRPGTASLALELLIFTAARSGDVLGATWGEFSGDLWVIPAERHKSKREFRIPLTSQALEVLEKMRPLRRPERGDWLFPGQKPGRPLSNMAMEKVLHRMSVDATPHGFRSTFRDWAGDCTPFPRELAEEALSHAVGNAVERAYRRSDALAKRRELMEAWAAYCERPSNVIQLRA